MNSLWWLTVSCSLPAPFSSGSHRVQFLGQSCSHCTPSPSLTWYVTMSVIMTNMLMIPSCQRGSSWSISVSSLWYPDLHWKSCRLDVQQQAQTKCRKILKFFPLPLPPALVWMAEIVQTWVASTYLSNLQLETEEFISIRHCQCNNTSAVYAVQHT